MKVIGKVSWNEATCPECGNRFNWAECYNGTVIKGEAKILVPGVFFCKGCDSFLQVENEEG